MINIDVLEEKVKRLEEDMDKIKKEVSMLLIKKETMIYKLDQIQKQLDEIQTSVNRDSGWRGFLIDFIKAAAQIAALVAAGKFIF
ncbi:MULTISPECIES: hypothetical protein [Bacillaceae]|uniref:Uncharacterized protein n=1 Tax=Domibacillus aminovorans TaxID=29332 RepID=A0A177L1W4_9BACI|nr:MULTISPECIES: hypothetical protein [Bacillaceae]OAH59382.1 hypothetical protein AWH48_14660 [Domibacillus aminovorans]